MRVLTLTSLFPSDARPRHGIFVETRLQQLVRDTGVDVRVIAPVPWFPFTASRFGSYARLAATPRMAVRKEGLRVIYPRYLMLPRLGVSLQPDSMARAAWSAVRSLERSGWSPDLIDAHYLYPDGVAAAIVARRIGVPFVMTARGTDVNVLSRLPGPGRRIRSAADEAAALVSVSEGLRAGLLALGIEPSKISVLRNGVDLSVFFEDDGDAARRQFGLPDREQKILVSVGNLVPEKGQALAMEALARIEGVHLVIVGDGPLAGELRSLAQSLGIAPRVTFLNPIPQEALRRLYSAASALLLTSTREGWPNVVLESLACGTPVVATDVGAVREMITDTAYGTVLATRSPIELADAVARHLSSPVPRDVLRKHAATYDWASVSKGQYELFKKALNATPSAV
jgi:teichuronic acid biosynthesis glycosyltransferase TuaC